MCAEFPETDVRLVQWAKWYRDGLKLSELGFSPCSSHIKLPGGCFKGIPDNPEAELVDKIVKQLSQSYYDIYLVLKSHYIHRDNNRDGAMMVTKNIEKHTGIKQNINIGKYQVYLKIGISWVDRGLHEIDSEIHQYELKRKKVLTI